VEIYGVEGIPEEDQKKWEAQKLGKDEPPEKRSRDDYSQPMLPPLPPQPGFMPGPNTMPQVPMGMPGMPMQMMMPGYGVSQMMSGMPQRQMLNSVAPMMPSSVPVTAMGSSPQMMGMGAPTFPAYSAPINTDGVAAGSGAGSSSMAKPKGFSTMSQGTGTKIMHPDEDCSLEERRASLPRYSKVNLYAGSIGPPGPMSSAPPVMGMSGSYPLMGQPSGYGHMPTGPGPVPPFPYRGRAP